MDVRACGCSQLLVLAELSAELSRPVAQAKLEGGAEVVYKKAREA